MDLLLPPSEVVDMEEWSELVGEGGRKEAEEAVPFDAGENGSLFRSAGSEPSRAGRENEE